MAQKKYLDSAGLSKFFENIANTFSEKKHTHTKSQITDFAHNHDDLYYNKLTIDSKLNDKSNTGHNHDERYYTQSIINGKFDTLSSQKQDVMKSVVLPSSSGSNKNKWVKFATIDLTSASAYVGCSGTLSFVRTEGASPEGFLKFEFRNGGTAGVTEAKNLAWVSISGSVFKDSVASVKVSDGKYDIYYKPINDYETCAIYLIDCYNTKYFTFNTGSYVSNIVAASVSYLSSYASSAESVAWGNVTGKPTSYTPSSHTHDDRYYTQTKMDTLLDAKVPTSRTVNGKALSANISLTASDVGASATGHTHDDRYYTESEVDSRLANKTDINKWQTPVQLLVWSRVCHVAYETATVGSSFLLNLRCTRSGVVCNATFMITASHNNNGNIIQLQSTSYSPFQVRTVADTNGDVYVEVYDYTGEGVTSGANQTWYCSLVPIATGKITKYTSFTSGANLPSGYVVSKTLTVKNSNTIVADEFIGKLDWSNITSKPDTYAPSAHNHDDRYYTEAEMDEKISAIDSAISGKADSSHNHDDRYYAQNKMDTLLDAKVPVSRTVNGKALSANISLTASDVGASASGHTHDDRYYTEGEIDTKLNGKANSSHTHAAGDITSVNASAITGVIAAANLPSYVDDVIEGYYSNSKFYKTKNSDDTYATEIAGETGKIYVNLNDNKTYRWSGTAFVVISETLALGETSTTAYRGDRGAAAYTHAASDTGKALTNGLYKITTSSRGHVTAGTAVTKADITGLGIPAQDTVYTHPTTSGNKHIPVGGSAGQFLKWAADGTAVWAECDIMKGASDGGIYSYDYSAEYVDGAAGLVPKPQGIEQTYFLRGDGKWTRLYFGSGLSVQENKKTHEINITNPGILNLYKGINDGCIMAETLGQGTFEIQVSGLKSAAYTDSSDYLPITGGTMTGSSSVQTSSVISGLELTAHTRYVDTSSNQEISVGVGSGHQNRGLYDDKNSKWLVYFDSNNNGYLNGNAATASAVAWGNVTDKPSTYTPPTATASALGGVKIGSNITVSSGTISLTKANVTSALGYTPPTKDTTYSAVTTSTNGLMTAADKTKLDALGGIVTITKSLTLTTSWADTGIAGTNLESGTYVVQVSGLSSDDGISTYSEIWSGVMSWYSGTTNSVNAEEILLHNAGHADNSGEIYLRTCRTSGGGYVKLQISSSIAATKVDSITFKFRKLI